MHTTTLTATPEKAIARWHKGFRVYMKEIENKRMTVGKPDEAGYRKIQLGEKNYGVGMEFKFENDTLYLKKFSPIASSMIQRFESKRVPLGMKYVLGLGEMLGAKEIFMKCHTSYDSDKRVLEQYLFREFYDEDLRGYNYRLRAAELNAYALLRVRDLWDAWCKKYAKEETSFQTELRAAGNGLAYRLYCNGIDTTVRFHSKDGAVALKDSDSAVEQVILNESQPESSFALFMENVLESGKIKVLLEPKSVHLDKYITRNFDGSEEVKTNLLDLYLQTNTIEELDNELLSKKEIREYQNFGYGERIDFLHLSDSYYIIRGGKVERFDIAEEAYQAYTERCIQAHQESTLLIVDRLRKKSF